MKKYRRRKFFIDKKLQTKYILLTMVMLLLYTIMLVVIMFVPYFIHLDMGASTVERADAARMLLSLHRSVWPAIGIVIVATGILTIFVSHGVAGPVYRFKKVIEEVTSGNLDIIVKLRKHDDLKDLAASLNNMIEEMRTLVKTLNGEREILNTCIKQLEAKVQGGHEHDPCDLELIDRLKNNRDAVQKVLNKYSA